MLSKTFFPQHPKAGEPTGFRDKVLKGEKRHTCRCNYDYWKKAIAKLKEREGILSLRQWGGKPYEKGSHTERVLDIGSGIVDVQELVMSREVIKDSEIYVEGEPGVFAVHEDYEYRAEVDGTPVDVSELAKNDGLSLEDFKAWFNPVFDKEKEARLTFAVIHFSTFRY